MTSLSTRLSEYLDHCRRFGASMTSVNHVLKPFSAFADAEGACCFLNCSGVDFPRFFVRIGTIFPALADPAGGVLGTSSFPAFVPVTPRSVRSLRFRFPASEDAPDVSWAAADDAHPF